MELNDRKLQCGSEYWKFNGLLKRSSFIKRMNKMLHAVINDHSSNGFCMGRWELCKVEMRIFCLFVCLFT